MKKWRVLLIDTKKSNPNHYICIAIQQALLDSEEVEFVIKVDAHDAIRKADANKCNLLFVFDGEELDRELCRRLATICGLSILWVTEDPYEISVNVANAALFDLVFTNDSGSVSAYGAKGRHLPLAGAKNFHFHPVAEVDHLRYDLFFAGTAWPNRAEFFRKLFDEAGSNLRPKIALPTNPHLPAVDIGLPPSQLAWRTSPIDFGRFVNASIATVLLPRVFSASGNKEFAETPPPRLFEAALAGGVQLVQEKLADTTYYFQPEREFLFFSDEKDFLEKLNILRSNPDLRRDIAKAAQSTALKKHCYEHRVNHVLDLAREYALAHVQDNSRITVSMVKPKLLFVLHNLRRNGNFGGVEVYAEQMNERLHDQYDIYFYAPKERAGSNGTVLLNSDGVVIEQFSFAKTLSPWLNSCSERETAFAEVLYKYQIGVVHFQHLIGHVPSLVHIAKSVGVATVLTVHDYYSVCHNFTLLSFKGSYCHPEKISLSQCDTCLWHTHHVLPGSQGNRRAFWNNVMASTDLLVFNTQGALDLISQIYPSVQNHKNKQVLPVPIEGRAGGTLFLNDARKDTGSPLKVAILGNFTHHKGASVIARAIPLLKEVEVEFHIYGFTSGEYGWLGNSGELPKVVVHGSYQPKELPSTLAQCDVSLHLSIWPETYCLTLSEAWQLGLVPIVTDIGALGERVTHGVNGLKIAADSEGELVQSIRLLAENRRLLGTLKSGIHSAPISYVDGHCNALAHAYQSIEISALRQLPNAVAPRLSTLSDIGIHIEKLNWAEAADQPPVLPSVSMNAHGKSLRVLIQKVLKHYRYYGLQSLAKTSLRYIRSRI
jgi:glycosyltransferase involved in cell wall biosynthesis/spore maturation protein CgeB